MEKCHYHPCLQKGLSSRAANYRPISLTCVTSKTLERIVSSQMFSYFVANQLINKAQHGFLKGLSTATNLLHIVIKSLQEISLLHQEYYC